MTSKEEMVQPMSISQLLGEMKSQFMSNCEGKPPPKLTLAQDVDIKEKIEPESANNSPETEADVPPILEPFTIKTEDLSTNESTFEEVDSKMHCTKPEDANHVKTNKRSLRHKLEEKNHVLKRSSRRRSKESNESVLQSAIARKEKSFTVPNKPLRSTRQLKPTQKILENLALAKLEKNRSFETDTHNNVKRIRNKKRSSRDSKSPVKKIKVSETVESEESAEEDVNNSDVRRSQRISSQTKEESDSETSDEPKLSLNIKISTPETSATEDLSISPRLCLCTQKTQLFAIENLQEPSFCTAVDSIDGKTIGCARSSDPKSPLMRPSGRIPYISLCQLHLQRLLRHNCCPTCGVFCTQGQFAQCPAQHFYHKSCVVAVDGVDCCPHCGRKDMHEIGLKMHSERSPVFHKTQTV